MRYTLLAKMEYKMHLKRSVAVSSLQNTRNRFNQKNCENSYKSFKSRAMSSHLIHTAPCSTRSNLAKKKMYTCQICTQEKTYPETRYQTWNHKEYLQVVQDTCNWEFQPPEPCRKLLTCTGTTNSWHILI